MFLECALAQLRRAVYMECTLDYSIYTVLLHFFVKLQTNVRPLIREDHLMGAFFLDDVIVGNDINQVYGKERGLNVQDKHNMHL